jgi:predicted CXXCH cytochrome family protein
MSRARSSIVVVGILLGAIVGAVIWAVRQRQEAPHFVGASTCGSCHPAELGAWRSSQHAAAMQDARDSNAILGRFDSTRVTAAGVTSTFVRRGNAHIVNTEGSDGQFHDFEIRYSFGVYPLQEYLVELSGGRIQPLPLAWDARPQSAGGQRWFELFPGPHIGHSDELHWTGRGTNWNYMCADCHSTAVRKGYVAGADSFHTTWSEIDVACEACHGPGSKHAGWARYPAWLRRLVWRGNQLPARLDERRGVAWTLAPNRNIASRGTPRPTDREIEMCAQCHARRTHLTDGYTAGARLFDFYAPLLLTSDLYFADGQQRDEVYTYGSFLQSKMYHAGVTCSDCHEPHSAKLRQPGNAVCTQCHRAAVYDTSAHHFHQKTSAGASCVSCHMPTRTYMQVDPRHDHSLRVPRPDLARYGVPNACANCHSDRKPEWASEELRRRGRDSTHGFQDFVGAFALDDERSADAPAALLRLADNAAEPAIVRASALARLAAYPSQSTATTAARHANDPSPLVRLAVLQLAEEVPPEQRAAFVAPMLSDSLRSLRIQAAWVLAPEASRLGGDVGQAFATAAREFVASQRYNADRAGNRILLGAFFTYLGQLDSASTEFESAIKLSPSATQGYLGLAAVLEARGRDADAVQILQRGLSAKPDDADLKAALAAITKKHD